MDKKVVVSERTFGGLHISGEIFTNNSVSLHNAKHAEKYITSIVKKYDFTELGSFYHKFPRSGFTGIVCLAESHIAFHTWPEFHSVTLDVFICNYFKNNEKNCRLVFDDIANFFHPSKITKRSFSRSGQKEKM